MSLTFYFLLFTQVYAQETMLFSETFSKESNQALYEKNYYWSGVLDPETIIESKELSPICDNNGSGSIIWQTYTNRNSSPPYGYFTASSKLAIQDGRLSSKLYANGNNMNTSGQAYLGQDLAILGSQQEKINHFARLTADFDLIGAHIYGGAGRLFIYFSLLINKSSRQFQYPVGQWVAKSGEEGLFPAAEGFPLFGRLDVKIKNIIDPKISDADFDRAFSDATVEGIKIKVIFNFISNYDKEMYLEWRVDDIKISQPSFMDTARQTDMAKITTVGEPINVATGNMFTSETDISLPPGQELFLGLSRAYNSQDDFNGAFGWGWRSNFDIVLAEQADASVVEQDEAGVYTIYTKNSDGTYTSSAGKYSTLTKNSDGAYTILRKHGKKLYFNSVGLLTKVEDRNGNYLNISRDENGILSEASDSSGRKLLFTSGAQGKIIQVTDPAGRVFKYDYDASGNLVKTTDPLNNETRYEYDGSHNLIHKTDANNHALYFEYDSDDRAYHSWQDNRNNEVTLTFDPINKITDVTDSLGNLTAYAYTYYGLVTEITDSPGGEQDFKWDSQLNKTKYEDENWNDTHFTYDARGNLLSIKDELWNTSTFTYEPNFDFIASATDTQGNLTEYTYDTKGNLIQTQDGLSNITTYSYDGLGNLVKQTDANNHTANFKYDSYNNLIQVTDALDNQTNFIYDILGNKTKITDAQGNQTLFNYDALNRLAQITYSDNSKVIYNYDSTGNLLSTADQNNNITANRYDEVNRLISVTDARGSVTRYTYDTEGDKLTVTDANNNQTRYFYDSLNRLIKTVDPANNQTLLSYDPVGNLISKTDANNNTINYTYDDLNRLTQKLYPDQAEDNFTYDSESRILATQNDSISYNYTYDVLGRQTQVSDSDNHILIYTYDAVGNKITSAADQGLLTQYSYDPLNRLTQIGSPLSGRVAELFYDNLSRRTQLNLTNVGKVTYSYNTLSRLTALNNQNLQKESADFSYTYDLAGNRTLAATSRGTYHYAYDNIYQLTQVKRLNSLVKDYGYDLLGNRTQVKSNQVQAYSSNNLNQYTRITHGLITADFTYDGNGNLTSVVKNLNPDAVTYIYDYENRLTKITQGSQSVGFAYDPWGRRIAKIINGITKIKYLYDGDDIIAEYDNSGVLLKKYLHGPGVDELIFVEILSPALSFASRYYYYYDGLGSVAGLTDAAGNSLESYIYDEYGRPLIRDSAGKIIPRSIICNRYLYTGREYDYETGLYYYRNRYYSPPAGEILNAGPHWLRWRDESVWVCGE